MEEDEMIEYTSNISIEKEGHTYINDVQKKQIIIEGVGNKNIINSCILSIDKNNVTVQTGKKIETMTMEELPTIIRIVSELLIKEGPKPKPKKKTTKKETPKEDKKTTKKTTPKKKKTTTKKKKTTTKE